jgi:hypothetical protein
MSRKRAETEVKSSKAPIRKTSPKETSPDDLELRKAGAGGVLASLKVLVERLPLAKLTTAQTTNLTLDIVGVILCCFFIINSKNDILKFICVCGIFALSVLCIISTDRRRRF